MDVKIFFKKLYKKIQDIANVFSNIPERFNFDTTESFLIGLEKNYNSDNSNLLEFTPKWLQIARKMIRARLE